MDPRVKAGVAFTLLFAPQAAAQVRSPGDPIRGLQATITAPSDLEFGRPVPISLELCNVSQSAISIDQWAGLWFVEVRDGDDRPLRCLMALDTLRSIQPPVPLSPGACWLTTLDRLRLVTGALSSTPKWQYSEPLTQGAYSLQATYRTDSTETYATWFRLVAERRQATGVATEDDHPKPWVGQVLSGTTALVIHE